MKGAIRAAAILCAVLIIPILVSYILVWFRSPLVLLILVVWQPLVFPHTTTFFEAGGRLSDPLPIAELQWALVVLIFSVAASRLRPFQQLAAALVTVLCVGLLYHQVIPAFGLRFEFDGP